MKKSELSVGMQVENTNGRIGTVIDVSGWTNPAGYARNETTVVWEGQRYTVSGYHGGPGVLVLWNDRNGAPTTWPRIEQARQLHPVGTYKAMRAAEDAAEAIESANAVLVANTWRGRLRARWGDATDALLADLEIPAEGPLDEEQAKVAATAIICGNHLRS